jgi:dipeptidyl aminopeptidase/acylaminoacyl peptidase
MDGSKKAIVIDVKTGDYSDPSFPVNHVAFNALKRTSDTSFAVIGSTATAPQSFFHLDITKPSNVNVLKASVEIGFPLTYFAPARNIKFPRNHGPGGGYAYGIFLPPTNSQYTGPDGALPPLIVAVHGGPTWQEGPGVYLRDQFWITRGYALVQVNYVGSSGYGKDYIDLLNLQWGVSDIADAVSCVEYLAKEGLIDPKRVGITGHSAGGYATMQALCKYPDVWAAGIAESGISDMQAMFDETHKFESQYLQPLCFEIDTPSEERKRIIEERSPIHWTENIKAPMLILSGEVDEIVPPNQAHLMAEKIKTGGGTVEVRVYEGEGHNFVKGSTLEDMEIRREAWFRKYLVEG